MVHRILITTLPMDASGKEPSYYFAKDNSDKQLYCEAVMPEEACCKYALSTYPIEEIIVLGTEKLKQLEAAESAPLLRSQRLFPPDLGDASGYGVLQYRLIQFFDGISLEEADFNDLLSAEEQKETEAFLLHFFNDRVESADQKKFSNYLHYLNENSSLLAEFTEALPAWLSDPEKDLERYKKWIAHYLYRELKLTRKLEPLEKNKAVRFRYLRVAGKESIAALRQLLEVFSSLEYDDGVPDTMELIVCIQNGHAAGMFDLMNAMQLSTLVPEMQVSIFRVIAETPVFDMPFHELQDQTMKYHISELLSGTRAFLRYGKTDLLVDYWNKANLQNPKIDRIIYGMRNIDSGISLCDIADLERGVKSLRDVMKNDLPITGNTPIEQCFSIVAESIRKDFGSILEGDQIPFIDLVRWSYRKGFWQQTLTLIESRAPRDFVDKGFYFYADGERSRKHAVEVFGEIYFDLKMFEKYKLNDISHYYIKYYSRQRAPRLSGDAYQQGYAKVRIDELDTRDEKLIRALTICPDRSALKDLLYAYYHLGDVRNATNHAEEEFGGFYAIMDEADLGSRMKLITQAIDYFIYCYDTVSKLVEKKKANVVTVDTSDLINYADELRKKYRRMREAESGKQE